MVLDILLDNDMQINESCSKLIELFKISGEIESITEAKSGVGKAIVSGTKKVEKGFRKGTHAVRYVGDDVVDVVKNTKGVPASAINLINSTYKKLKEMDKNKRRNYIIEGGIHKKILRNIKMIIKVGAIGLMGGPLYGLIGFLVMVAIDNKSDYKVRREIVNELELEKKMVKEKLDDAKSEGRKEEKYKLMRLHDKLDKDIDRIKYRITI